MVNLKEYLHPKMDILFLALNAPEKSNTNKHWFSGNLSFWNLLFRSGLITEQIFDPLKGDVAVFGNNNINYQNWIFGVTDLNRRDVQTYSSNVEVSSEDVKRVLGILNKHDVKRLCLMHSKVGEAFRDFYPDFIINDNRYGMIGKYNNTLIHEVPFHNAPVSNKEEFYKQLINSDNKVKTKSLQVKVQEVQNSKPSVPSQSFIIPSSDNSITGLDISKGQLRITADFKCYFPDHNDYLTISYGENQTSNVTFKHRGKRSHILHIGKGFYQMNNFSEEDRVKFSIIKAKKHFLLQKI